MRKIERKIVGIVARSGDGKYLLGQRIPSQSYGGRWVVLGGGIEEGETPEVAARRELFEESGIDITSFPLSNISTGIKGESEKTLRTGERVICEMECTDFMVCLPEDSSKIKVQYEDREFCDMKWFKKEEIKDLELSPISQELFEKIKLINKK